MLSDNKFNSIRAVVTKCNLECKRKIVWKTTKIVFYKLKRVIAVLLFSMIDQFFQIENVGNEPNCKHKVKEKLPQNGKIWIKIFNQRSLGFLDSRKTLSLEHCHSLILPTIVHHGRAFFQTSFTFSTIYFRYRNYGGSYVS